ncbi:uncharacterized protein FTOL_13863 [Fusarium torulosum]|uniref:Uncharacterized protein n=1 Tax=Fusarium torulosum TaxID=33205 RepID=A0AAE8SQ92_9HYPO|nr:uncharacterized protein FTOL_13863 [Fusarium torulosum]
MTLVQSILHTESSKGRSGQLKRHLQGDMIRWYAALGGSISHDWSAQKAKVRGKTLSSRTPPSLEPLHYRGCPSPFMGLWPNKTTR